MALHIGHEIQQELRRQERSVTWFARRLACDRTNVYRIFDKESLDTRLLMRISTILVRDFFVLYSQQLNTEL
ncbi:MAG: XRE family transcriptional regulator [Bacteroidaceae bacterium]|nr:XRE family transcriptional regulator [Bacteroidaceae bacterium]